MPKKVKSKSRKKTKKISKRSLKTRRGGVRSIVHRGVLAWDDSVDVWSPPRIGPRVLD